MLTIILTLTMVTHPINVNVNGHTYEVARPSLIEYPELYKDGMQVGPDFNNNAG